MDKKEKKSDTLKHSRKKYNIIELTYKIYLGLLFLGNLLTAIVTILFNSFIQSQLSHVPSYVFYIMGVFAIINIVSVVALYKNKMWGFYLFASLALIIFITNFSRGLDFLINLSGFIPLVILSALLYYKNKKK